MATQQLADECVHGGVYGGAGGRKLSGQLAPIALDSLGVSILCD